MKTIVDYIQACKWGESHYLIFSNNVFDHLVYYSHLVPLIASILLAGFIYFYNRKLLAVRWFMVVAMLLSLWLFSDLVLWATEYPPLVMFFWTLLILIEPMIYACMLFFLYAFIDGKDMAFPKKLALFALFLPIIILAPSHFALTSFDLTNCEREALEGPLVYYSYLVQVVISLWILILGMERFIRFKEKSQKAKVALITAGAVFFLLSFAMGNVVGSLLENWQIGQYGLFGIPVFMAMLSYLIVKYQAFSIKLIATQLLVAVLCLLIFSILFVRDISLVQTIVLITFGLCVVLGNLLVVSVRREVRLREELQVANAGQADLLHIINHQIKGYMTKARYVFDDLLHDQSYGLNEKTKPMIQEGYASVTEGVNFVQDFLNASNIEKGTFTYSMAPMDFEEVVKAVVAGQKESATQKGLSYDLDIKPGDYRMTGDKAQLNQAVRNLIDNSVKYTPKGGLKISLERKLKCIVFKISDTGVGLSDEVKPKLFTKGGRDKDSIKINISSTGFGLAFVKGVAEAHQGRVWAESPGVGKGSTFYMELPAA